MKRTLILLATLVIAAAGLQAQTNTQSNNQTNQSKSDEMSVEESYLQESVEMMIIRETSRADSRDQKMVALEYIGDALDRGNKGPEVTAALDYLATEGVITKSRTNGRVVNNFPDVRTKAAEYLGEIKTPEAKNTLIKMVMADPEPMVLTEAVKSLSKIGINDNDDVVNAISWVANRFDVLNPDNLLALSVVDAIAALAENNGGIGDSQAIRTLIRISEGNYITPVKDKAKAVLKDLRKYNSTNGK